MKVTGARTHPYAAVGRSGAVARPSAPGAVGPVAPVDRAAFLGLTEAELTPAVQGALKTLVSEIDDLRRELAGLKAKLSELEGLADRDALTPLFNRRAFMRELSRIRTFSQRYEVPASLVYFDLDGFKAVNDRHGHAAGDSVLQAVAERLLSHVRDSDVVGRMGGDEFAVILVQADRATAEAKAASLVEALESDPIKFGDWSAPLRLSWGVEAVSPELEPEQILSQADEAMYVRKRARRAGEPVAAANK